MSPKNRRTENSAAADENFDVEAQKESLNYTPNLEADYTATLKKNAAQAGVNLSDYEEDTLKTDLNPETAKVGAIPVRVTNDSSEPDGKNLDSFLSKGVQLFLAKNDAKIPLICDWDLELIPEDLHKQFDSYLNKKYLSYDLRELLEKNIKMVAIYVNGRTTNLVESFVNERQIPTVIPMPVGKEVVMKSQFVIMPGEIVLVTGRQYESLNRYEMKKLTIEKATGDSTTDWTGFIMFKEVKTKEDALRAKRSFICENDIMRGYVQVNINDFINNNVVRQEHGVIRAEDF
jgi:hypothetical protein